MIPQKTNVGSSSYTEAKLTDEFKENVQSDLNAFKQTDVLELPLPCDHLTLSERDYIKKISMEYDLEFKEKGEVKMSLIYSPWWTFWYYEHNFWIVSLGIIVRWYLIIYSKQGWTNV